MESNRPRYFTFFVAGCAIVVVFTILTFDVQRDLSWQPWSTLAGQEISPRRQRHKTVVLVYTRFFRNYNWVKNESRCCSEHFQLTYEKGRFKESDVVVFHARNMPSFDVLKSLLKSKPISQRWVYALWESPKATPDTTRLNGLFNATWTYRTDSDIWGPYGRYERLSQEDIKKNEMANKTDYTEGKSELVAWMVSNCRSKLRIGFVHELKKYIKVDVFGRCSGKIFHDPRSCSKHRDKTRDCLKRYKFYLSFENALCEDYVTEKYWGHLGKNVTLFLSLVLSNFSFLDLFWKKCTRQTVPIPRTPNNGNLL